MVGGTGGLLVHHLCLLKVYCQSQCGSCICKASYYSLEGFLSVCQEDTIVSKQQVNDQFFYCLVMGQHAAEVEHSSICAELDVDATLQAFFSFSTHHCEEDGKKCWCKVAALLHAILNREQVWELPVVLHLSLLVGVDFMIIYFSKQKTLKLLYILKPNERVLSPFQIRFKNTGKSFATDFPPSQMKVDF